MKQINIWAVLTFLFGLTLLWILKNYLDDKNVIDAYSKRADCILRAQDLDQRGFCQDISDFKVNFRGYGVK